MVNVALIGAGNHCCGNHAPSLKHYAERHPDTVSLDAVCDLDAEKARKAAEEFGFKLSTTAIDELFAPGTEPINALVAVLPIPVMLEATPKLFARGVPIMIEKPLGLGLRETEAVCEAAQQTEMQEKVMVSLNRRYDPSLARALEWVAQQPPIRYVRASMVRVKRTEDEFVWGTGIHLIDALNHVAGPLALRDRPAFCPGQNSPDSWRLAVLEGRDGIDAVLEIMPTAGESEEKFRIAGEGYQIDVSVGTFGKWSVRAVKEGTVELEETSAPDGPVYLNNGACEETAAFLDAVVAGDSLPAPSLADAYESSCLAAQIEAMAMD